MRFTGLKYLQLLACLGLFACGSAERYDVVIVGGGASGTAAGLQAARMGARTLIVEEFDWLGGMLTSAGVSATDGNYRLRGGIWDEFRTELARHYGCDSALMTGWVSNVLFEPSVGDSIFKRLVAREPNLTGGRDGRARKGCMAAGCPAGRPAPAGRGRRARRCDGAGRRRPDGRRPL